MRRLVAHAYASAGVAVRGVKDWDGWTQNVAFVSPGLFSVAKPAVSMHLTCRSFHPSPCPLHHPTPSFSLEAAGAASGLSAAMPVRSNSCEVQEISAIIKETFDLQSVLVNDGSLREPPTRRTLVPPRHMRHLKDSGIY